MKKLFEDAELELVRFGKSDIIVTSDLEEGDFDVEIEAGEVGNTDTDDGGAAPQSDDGNVNDSFDIADIG